VSFRAEAAHLSALTSEAVVFGPGNMTVAHKSEEFVPTVELSECTAHLTTVTETLCR
jgi:acetylornithine deacetylase